jgi:hypothetical protein
LIAFILNTALIYAAYEAFDDDKIGFGSVITIVEFGFYAGNIYGSVNSAHKYNRSGTSIFIENLQKNMKINLSGGFQPDTQEREIVLAFESAF